MNEDRKIPPYIDMNEAMGTAVVTLSRPHTRKGEAISEVTVKEPIVRDWETMDKATGGDIARNVMLLANLTGWTPDELRNLPARDFRRLDEAAGFFMF